MLALVLPLLLAAPAPAPVAADPAPRLTASEARMAATVDAEYERSVALLERLVNQNSGTMNLPGVAKVGAMMTEQLRGLALR